MGSKIPLARKIGLSRRGCTRQKGTEIKHSISMNRSARRAKETLLTLQQPEDEKGEEFLRGDSGGSGEVLQAEIVSAFKVKRY